ncbi:MAG: 23S rRNA (pseudouridine(1915)-N(3))-methyltransferase RlmH [Firmicutes bacterium]|nr:23S rRNA (pseudouridine(1915)-N(3))-methyltransferase RlmH [Bacillota bacterium]
MNIEIICTGKLKEKYWQDAAAEYSKRLSRFCKLTVTELTEARLPDKAGPAEERQAIEAESRAVLKKLEAGPDCYVIALDVKGKALSSEQLSEKLEALALEGKSRIAFVIGGSLGLSKELLERADFRLSFSAMTFPHQMMRVILLEQIYRAFKIGAGESYHK